MRSLLLLICAVMLLASCKTQHYAPTGLRLELAASEQGDDSIVQPLKDKEIVTEHPCLDEPATKPVYASHKNYRKKLSIPKIVKAELKALDLPKINFPKKTVISGEKEFSAANLFIIIVTILLAGAFITLLLVLLANSTVNSGFVVALLAIGGVALAVLLIIFFSNA